MPSSSYSATYFLIISWPLWYPFLFLETSLLHIHTHPFVSTSGLYPVLACVSDNCTVTRFVPFAITPITRRKWSNCIKDQKHIIVGPTGVSAIAASTGYFDKSRSKLTSALHWTSTTRSSCVDIAKRVCRSLLEAGISTFFSCFYQLFQPYS